MTIENDLRQWPGADLPNSAQLTSSLTVSLVRPQDLLALEVDCINLQLLARPARLERVDPNAAAFIIVKFPSQHVAEEVFVDNAPDGTSPSPVASDPPVGARLAGPSRLVFQVPTGVTSIPYTTQGLLNACQTFPLRVAANAVPPTLPSLHTLVPQPAGPLSLAAPGLSRQVENGTVRSALRLRRAQRQQAQRGRLVTGSYQAQRHGDGETARGLASLAPFPQPPAPQETAIEFPFRLLLSPHQLAAWVHALTPVTSASGRTELWHTRLGSRALHGGVDEQSPELRTVRAIWTRDPGFQGSNPTPPNKPEVGLFPMALTNVNRHDIVHLSSNFNLTVSDQGNTKAFDPQPLAVNRLMLSALGAWADMRGVWPPELPAGLSVSEWRQLSTMGRDHYVRIVDEGFLYPFGHRAVLTSVSERKFHPLTPGNVAYVRQRQFLIVREPERTYGLSTVVGGAKLARQFPFTRVRITTLVTPLLNDPAKTPADVPGANILQHGKAAFWPSVGNQLFQFHMQVTDLEGHESELTAPMIYISKGIADAYLTDIEDSYNDDDHLPWRTSQMHGQKVAYAESQAIDDTTFETQSITFSSHIPLDYNTLPHNAPRFFPMVSQAKIEIPAIKHLAGNTTSAAVQFSDAYLNHGFHTPGQNQGGMFLDMVKGSVVPLNFTGQGDRSGGLVQPNMQISGLSRVMGPIAGPTSEIAKGIFNPQEFFAGLNAKVFGCINLFDIIGFVGDLAGEPDLVPKMITQASNTAEQFLQDIEDFLEHLPVVTFLRDILDFLARLPVGQFLQAITTLSTVLEDIGSLGTALQEDIATLKDDFKNLTNIKQGIASDLETHLNTFLTHLVDLQKVLPNSSLIPKVKEQLQQHIAQFQALLEGKVQEFIALVQTLGSLAQNLYTDITDIIGDFGDLPESVQGTPIKLQQHLESFTGHLDNLAGALSGVDLDLNVKATLEQRIAQFKTVLEKVETFVALVQSLGQLALDLKDDIGCLIEDFGNLPDSASNGALTNHLKAFKDHLSPLLNLIPVANLSAGVAKELPKRIAQFKEILEEIQPFVDLVVGALEVPRQIKVKFDWRPLLKPFGFDPKAPIFLPLDNRGLRIGVEARAVTGSLSKPSFDVICSLEKFDINLIAPASFLIIHFNRLQLTVANGKKPDVDVVIDKVEFVGVLSFVETLKELIPLDGFSDPPDLDVTAEGVKASYSLALPNVGVGLFSLENLSLGAAFTLPFIGGPMTLGFNFCERQNPFLLTVTLFGGGGFFGITLSPSGVQLLEAAFEFGAAVSINLGVVSGGVSVMAGIYFKMELDNATLEGYLRLRGEVDVLGIISASLELRMDLHYEFSTDSCVGKATLIIEIEIIFFSKTVEVSCERRFSGANSDPTFLEVMAPDPNDASFQPWHEYCQAFAA